MRETIGDGQHLHFAAWNGQVSVVELLTDKKYAAPETAETASAPENLYKFLLISEFCGSWG